MARLAPLVVLVLSSIALVTAAKLSTPAPHAPQKPNPANNDVPKAVAGAASADPVTGGASDTHYRQDAFNHNWGFEDTEDFPSKPKQKRVPVERLMGGPYPTTTTTPLYEYYSRNLHDHYYTTKWNDLRDVSADGKHWILSKNWEYRGVLAFIFTSQQPGTIPLYQYWSVQHNDHAMTTDIKKFGVRKEGYKFKKLLGFVFPRPKPGTYGISEFYDRQDADHMYSEHRQLDYDRKHPESRHYAYLKTPFYAFRTPNDNVDAHMPVPMGADPVPLPEIPPSDHPDFDWKKHQLEEVGKPAAELVAYRSAMYKDSLITVNPNLVPNDGAGTWGRKGTIGYCYHGEEPGTVPLHRYYNRFHHNHFYTTDMKEPLKRYGWIWLGVECYVYNNAGHKDTVPLKRFFHLAFGDHLYVTKDSDAPAGYEFERITAYVRTTPGSPSIKQATAAEDEKPAGTHDKNPTDYHGLHGDSSLDELGNPDAVNMKGVPRVPEHLREARPGEYTHVQNRETKPVADDKSRYVHKSHAAMHADLFAPAQK